MSEEAYNRIRGADIGRFTVTTRDRPPMLRDGRIYPICLVPARYQAFPGWYELPDSKSLACRIIGNAVPPLAMKKWVQAWA